MSRRQPERVTRQSTAKSIADCQLPIADFFPLSFITSSELFAQLFAFPPVLLLAVAPIGNRQSEIGNNYTSTSMIS